MARHAIFNVSLVLLLLLVSGFQARAHPHVFVDVDIEVGFDPEGSIKNLRFDWIFDDMYSAFMMQGVERSNGKPTAAALEKLADVFMEKIDEADYFTSAIAADGHELQITGALDVQLTLTDAKRLRLAFTAPLRSVVGHVEKVSIQVFDPQYILAFKVSSDARLASAPLHCTSVMTEPPPLTASDALLLNDSVRTNVLDPNFGSRLASKIIIDCRASPK